MSRFTTTVALASALFAGVPLVAPEVASAQTAPAGQFGQRTGGGGYVPSTNDPGCVGIICNPLPSLNASGGPARNPSEVAPPPPCQGLICGLTPYSMQRPYTAADAAAAARAQAAAQPAEPAMPTKRARKTRKAKVAKARTPAPVESEAAR